MATNLPRALTCWKEIAEYLHKGVRTVQRWERELGLPIHRPPNRSSGIVRALPAELDAWMKVQQAADDEHRETEWLRDKVEKLRTENEVLRRALSSLLARPSYRRSDRSEDIPIQSLWEQSVQLLIANISARSRQNELLERSKQLRSLVEQANPAGASSRYEDSAPNRNRVRPPLN